VLRIFFVGLVKPTSHISVNDADVMDQTKQGQGLKDPVHRDDVDPPSACDDFLMDSIGAEWSFCQSKRSDDLDSRQSYAESSLLQTVNSVGFKSTLGDHNCAFLSSNPHKNMLPGVI
jgi:hypothetical protein